MLHPLGSLGHAPFGFDSRSVEGKHRFENLSRLRFAGPLTLGKGNLIESHHPDRSAPASSGGQPLPSCPYLRLFALAAHSSAGAQMRPTADGVRGVSLADGPLVSTGLWIRHSTTPWSGPVLATVIA